MKKGLDKEDGQQARHKGEAAVCLGGIWLGLGTTTMIEPWDEMDGWMDG